jgi:hypothetical protein
MNNLEKIFGSLKNIALSSRERANMRMYLQAHIRENPPKTYVSNVFVNSYQGLVETLKNIGGSRTVIGHPVAALCTLVLCVGIGTSFAADYAVPGQALYSIKTKVNEPILGALATTPSAKADWNAELTTRRLKEAEVLAATNKLLPSAVVDIESGLNSAFEGFSTNIALVSDTDTIAATNAQSELEASLNAHEVVLDALPTKQKEGAVRISSRVREQTEVISKERSVSEAVATASDTPEVKTAALKRKKYAEDAVDQVQIRSGALSDARAASSTSEISKEAESDIAAGEKDAQKGRWGKAYAAFQDAVRKAKETTESVDTRAWLKKRFKIDIDHSANEVATSTAQDNQNKNRSDTDDRDE